jgi:putative transposase
MTYKSFKYRIYPNKEQEELMLKHMGCSRWVYNYALNKKIISYQETGKGLSRFDIQKDLPELKKNEDTSWLKEVNSQTLQTSLENLDKAFTRFFKEKKGFPNFKSKKENRQSFNIPQNTMIDFDNGKLRLPKFKSDIKIKIDRKFDGNIKTSTITRTSTGKYFISILVELQQELPKKKPLDEKQAIGIDLGIKTFATLSNGMEIENPKHLKKSLKKLKKQQRKVSRKVKGSNNRKKEVKKLALIHEKVTNKRNDFLHKISYYLVTNFDTLCLETLKSGNMMKNHRLAQALSDIAIGKFNELIDYKSEWYGTNILRIGQFEPSSKMCYCGTINKQLKLSDRIWTCNHCGTTHDRDVLAANNIKHFAFTKNNTAGTAEIHACGDMMDVSQSAQETKPSLVVW